MSVGLSRFRIEGLHKRYTIDVPIKENRLVLVGENGTGKSTVANLIFLFLTRQWNRIPSSYDFESISAVIDSKEISFTREELTQSNQSHRLLEKRFGPTTTRKIQRLLDQIPLEDLLNNRENISIYALQFDIPRVILRDYLDFVLLEPPTTSDKIQNLSSTLEQIFQYKVLYLPTYRRIEQDLSGILQSRRLSSSTRRELQLAFEEIHLESKSETFVELVEFGMQDVVNTISSKMQELKDGLGAELNKLASTYLRDVILGIYQSAEPSEIRGLDEETINSLFNRIDQTVLPKLEQQQLRQIINEIKTRNDFQDKDKVVVHFLTKLIRLQLQQQEKERGVREFVDVCNRYLTGKKFVYDNINFQMSIKLDDLYMHSAPTDQTFSENNLQQLEMSKLSSGEKQIVSLFSQIYLSGSSNYFVIIDEPELSLSVPWQKRFLPDILDSEICSGLIAVTHSPYIFDNALDNYTRSLESFMEPVNAKR